MGPPVIDEDVYDVRYRRAHRRRRPGWLSLVPRPEARRNYLTLHPHHGVRTRELDVALVMVKQYRRLGSKYHIVKLVPIHR